MENEQIETVESESAAPAVRYYHVAPWKMAVLSVLTFGLYEIYWFYKCWSYIRDRDGSEIWPFWRAVFGVFWFYSLHSDIAREKHGHSANTSFALAGFYAVMTGMIKMQDPLWLMSFLTYLAILPLVRDIEGLNSAAGVVGPTYRRFGLRHIAVSLLGLSLLVPTLLTTLHLSPPTYVEKGSELPGHAFDMLRERGLLADGEEIAYFYSTAVFFYSSDGNFITDERVVSYWEDAGEFHSQEARYSEIADISVDYSVSNLEDTEVLVERQDGVRFFLVVSADQRRDRLFVGQLQHNWQNALEQMPAPEASAAGETEADPDGESEPESELGSPVGIESPAGAAAEEESPSGGS